MYTTFKPLLIILSLALLFVPKLYAQNPSFQKLDEYGAQKPWTHEQFVNDPEVFQFAIVSDRTGGHRPGIFGKAVHKLNLLQPEFVMSVGDFIEGYTKDEKIIQKEWQEFDSLLQPLEAPFFYLPGNHDISNDVMRETWKAKYGKSYYAFLYQDVLFICMDTNDGDGVTMSEEQITYVKNVIQKHTDVRWTMLFMHHPIWNYQDLSGFQKIEASLAGREYTVIAGHRHSYLYQERNDKNYITLATTGGGSQLRGPSFGEFDHVVWVTMTQDKGPILVNVALDGIIEKDIVTPQGRALATALLEAADMPTEVLVSQQKDDCGSIRLLVNNPTDLPMKLNASLLHHHQLQADKSRWDILVKPHEAEEISFNFQPLAMAKTQKAADAFVLNWELSYAIDSLKNMVLKGEKQLKAEAESQVKISPEEDKFLDQLEVRLDYPFSGQEIRFTLNGQAPTTKDPLYEQPFMIEESTTLMTRIFNDSLSSPVKTTKFEKVKPLKAQKLKKAQKGLSYLYYEGEWKHLPEFENIQSVKSGIATDFDVEKIAGTREDHFAILYDGFINISEEGMYTFTLNSDDGARLSIAGQLVIDNDGSHSSAVQQGSIALKAGYHPIKIEYFEDFLEEKLEIGMKTKGQEDASSIQNLLFH